MGFSLVLAVVMLVAGLTVLRPWLDPHEHPWRFIFFWFACAWETVLVLLLALLDLLLIRAQARAARKAITGRVFQEHAEFTGCPGLRLESRRARRCLTTQTSESGPSP